MATAAQIIAKRLYDAGCRHAFGIPGGEVLAMMEALEEAGISFTLTKHETGAGYMAEGVYYATASPVVLLATIGPGISNAVNAIANASQEHIPLIVLSGCVDEAARHSYNHQVIDHRAMLEPMVKAGFTIADGAADIITDKALSIALDGRPGPVHIDLPIGLAGREQPESKGIIKLPHAPVAPAEGPELDRARDMLARAQNPIIMAGLDVLDEEGAIEELRRFAIDFNIPVMSTYKAKGAFPEDHELSMQGHGLSPLSDKFALPLIDAADLVIVAGYDPIEMRTGWINPWDSAKAVEFAHEANEHYVHQSALSFVCSIGAGLRALRQGAEVRDIWRGGEPAKMRAELIAEFSADEDWGPGAATEAIRRALPDDAIITADTGAHRILLTQMWECVKPRSLLHSSGFGTMGCALPMAMGYKLVKPDAPVIAVTGDAGLEMVMGELATLRDMKMNLPIIVFADEALALIELKQRGSGRDNLGVDFGATDFPALAQAMGGTGRVAANVKALEDEIARAFARDGFTIISIPIARKAYDGKF